MMRDNGGPAFPHPSGEFNAGAGGMTLRDWFAGRAVTALAEEMSFADARKYAKEIAGTAYVIADAMLAERNK